MNDNNIDSFLSRPEFSNVSAANQAQQNSQDASAPVSQEIPEDVQSIISDFYGNSSDDAVDAAAGRLATTGITPVDTSPANTSAADQLQISMQELEDAVRQAVTEDGTAVTYASWTSSADIADEEDGNDEDYDNEDGEFGADEDSAAQPTPSSEAEPQVYDAPSDNTSRFRGAPWFETIKNTSFSIIGLGGIGSYVAFFLSRLRPRNISLIDGDSVDASNMSGQLYRTSDIHASKVNAASWIMRDFSDYFNSTAINIRVTARNMNIIGPYTFCGLDNMTARRDCFRLWKARFGNSSDALFIDGRLAMEEYQIFCIPGGDTERQNTYEKEWLFSDGEAEETVCSLKQTSFMAGAIAAMMVNIAVNYFTNVALSAPIRDVPFFTSYSGSCVYLKTE